MEHTSVRRIYLPHARHSVHRPAHGVAVHEVAAEPETAVALRKVWVSVHGVCHEQREEEHCTRGMSNFNLLFPVPLFPPLSPTIFL